MRLGVVFSQGNQEIPLRQVQAHPLDLDTLVDASAVGKPWEVEIGFGKGRYLLQQAFSHPERRFFGIEVVSKYYRMVRKRSLRNTDKHHLLLARGEALYMLSAVLPKGFASVLHIYFPDPWPKSRHHRRRLFDPETVDLVLGILRPGGTLYFATDFISYGEQVVEILENFPGLEVQRIHEPWSDGARTNYEAKYILEGRPILRLTARLEGTHSDGGIIHPHGSAGILAATAARRKEDTDA